MAEGSLSQEDIDAILNSTGGSTGGDVGSSGSDFTASSSDLADLDSLLGGSSGGGGPSSADIMGALGAPAPSKPTTRAGSPVTSSTSNLNLLMDVTMSLTVELGRTHMYIKDVLELSEGAVVELDKNVGEELDLLANGKLVGKARLVMFDDYYGVQVTHVIDPAERMKV
jgi:flagellar motor switch protein FliN